MSWYIGLDFQDGSGYREITDNVLLKSLKRTQTLHNKLAPTSDMLSFTMADNATIRQLLLTATDDVLIKVTKDSSDYFYGRVRTNHKITTTNYVNGIAVECEDNSYRLQKKITSLISWVGYSVSDTSTTSNSIIHQLLTSAGYSSGDINVSDILKTIDYYVIEENTTTYWDALKQILYEFGYFFYHNEGGQFCIYDFAPSSVANSNNFNNSNMYSKLEISKVFEQYEAVYVDWQSHETLSSTIVFSDTTGGDSQYKCNINLSAGDYYPTGSDTKTVYCEYKIQDREIIAVTGAALDLVADSDIVTDTATYEATRAIIKLHNTGSGVETIYKFDITGNAVVKGDKNQSQRINVVGTEKVLKITSKFITAKTDGDKLANALAKYYRYSDFTYRLKSDTVYAVGTYVTLTETESGLSGETCRVVKREDNAVDDYITYDIEAVAEYTADSVTEVGYHAPPAVSVQVENNFGSISDRPTYDEVIDTGWDSGTGTTTPTAPSIYEITAYFKAIVLKWDRQKYLTNFEKYQVQVSDDNTNWYSLKFDGTDWKDTLNGTTDWYTEMLVHAALPFGGTEAAPTGKTLYYRVRRVTKDGTTSSWSTSVSGTTLTVQTGDMAENSITVNKVAASTLEALFAKIAYSLSVGYSGSGTYDSPVEGDRRAYIDDDELRFEEYTGGAWSTVKGIKIGGALAGLFLSLISCNMWFNPQADLPSSVEFFPESNFRVFNWENVYTDQNGDDPWATKTRTAFDSTYKKFGSYSLYGTSADSYSVQTSNSADYWVPGSDSSFGVWIYPTKLTAYSVGIPSMSVKYNGSTGLDNVWMYVYSDMIRIGVTKGGSSTSYTDNVSLSLSLNTWHYLALMYDSVNDKLTLTVDNTTNHVFSISAGTWSSGLTGNMAVMGYSDPSVRNVYIDETIFAPDELIDPDIWIQHYNHNVAWNTDYSAKDLILKPASGGRIIFDDQSDDSAGTLHFITIVDIYSANPAEATDITVGCGSHIPSGAKAVNLTCYYKRGSGNMIINFNHTTPAQTDYNDIILDYVHTDYVTQKVITQVDNNGKFYFKVSSGVCDYIYIKLLGYWI